MMADGKALQMGTSHELGQNFARLFDITYLDDAGAQQLAWTTSWGSSTRMVGGLIMAHGDDRGLVVPPALAAVQAVVVLVKDEDGSGDAARRLGAELADAGVRVEVDDRVATSFGRRATDWELKGVPIRIEVGPRDLASGEVTIVRRDTGEKQAVGVGEVAARAAELTTTIQADILGRAIARRDERIADVATIEEAAEAAAEGWAKLPWDVVRGDGERRLAQDAITVRCLQREDGTVPAADDEPGVVAYVARSY
jgi:prolyl-tRNA synthetase